MTPAPSAETQALLQVLRGALLRYAPAAEGFLLAVSGGLDSMALLHLTAESGLGSEGRLVVAHLNHGLRGEESRRDAELVRVAAERLGLPVVVEVLAESELQQRPGETLEEAARKVRYRFLQRVAEEQRLAVILTAHHANDQAETVMHHIARGTGLSGLRGIPGSRHITDEVRLVRPLLSVTRVQLEAYIAERGILFGEDASNVDGRHTRNRIRHEVLPLLRGLLNPALDAALNRLAEQAVEVTDYLDVLADDLLQKSVLQEDVAVCRLQCAVLQESPGLLLRHALIRLWDRVGWPRQRMSYEHWQRLERIVRDPSSLSLPAGIRAEVRRQLLILSYSPEKPGRIQI
jgi:tRNA(Ile)-lysidine synthase